MNTQIPTVKTWKYNPGSSKSKIKIIVAIMTDPCYNAASKNIKKLFLMPSEPFSDGGLYNKKPFCYLIFRIK